MAQVLQHPFLTGKEALRLQGEEAAFDVFISYRVASDRALAENLFTVLTAAGTRVWLDAKCLQPGESWEDGFCSGLAQSSIFIPILSRGAIKNFSQLSSTSPCDNVLLEHLLAIEFQRRALLQFIYPLFVGDLEAGKTYRNYFSSGCHPQVDSTVRVPSVEKKFSEHLDRLALGCSILTDAEMPVAVILEGITKNQGSFLEGPADEALLLTKVQCDIRAMVEKRGQLSKRAPKETIVD